ncbi:MAG: lamin tail domain-containing protein [Archangiaceae bacterium]|nr:lamin tail domain-containing protein [Archangiaceae bacterium]
MKTSRLLLLSLLALGCQQTEKLVLPEPPQIDKFVATPATVAKGGMVTLSWQTRNGDVEVLDVTKDTAVSGVDKSAHDGSVMVSIDAQSLFVLNVTNSRGVKVTAVASVALEGAAQQTMFAALPAKIAPGATSTLVWTAPGAHAVSVTPMGGAALDLHGQVETGSVQVAPMSSTQYVLNADGAPKTVDLTVTQGIVSFTTSKLLAGSGDMVTLSWKTVNATKVTLSSPGRGVITTETDAAKVADGSVAVTLGSFPVGSSVNYVLTVEGAGAPLTQTIRVVIGTPPVIDSFTGPTFVKPSSPITLAWKTHGADAIEVSTGGVTFYRSPTATVAADGSVQITGPAATADYVLTAIHSPSGARVTKTLTQTVVGPVTVNSFTATPNSVTGGTMVTLTWDVSNAKRLRVRDGDGTTIATASGNSAGMGTVSAYPNANTTYTLDADNTLDAPVTATTNVTVTAPAALSSTSTVVLANNSADVSWTVGGGTAQIYGLPHSNVDVGAGSTGFVDIKTTGTKVTFSSNDEGITTVAIPDFDSWIFGEHCGPQFTFSTNGYVVCGPRSTANYVSTPIPNPGSERNMISPYWEDLEVNVGGVYWQVIGDAPERTLIVQWDNAHIFLEDAMVLTFEAKITQTGVVTFEYKNLDLAGVAVAPVVGVQGRTAGVGGLPPLVGTSQTFFGPRTSPVSVVFSDIFDASGFIKLPGGYLRASYRPASFVRTGEISISEVMHSPAPAIAATGEWFEVFNKSTVAIDLAGWSVDLGASGNFLIDAGVPLAPGASVILGQTERDAGNDNVPTAFVYGPQVALSDDAGTLSLFNVNYRSSAAYRAADAGNGGAGVSVVTDSQPHLVTGDSTTAAPHPLNCNSTASFGTQLPAQLGTPGAYDRCGVPMTMRTIAPSFREIADAGTALFNSTTTFNDAVATIDLSSAPFPFGGANVSTAVVSTNGWLILKSYTGTSTPTNKTAPSTAAPSGSVLAPFWDDLDRNATVANSNVYLARVAAGQDAANPGAHWIVEWKSYMHISANDDLNFEVKLFDDGTVDYQYGTMNSGSTSSYGNGNTATVWLGVGRWWRRPDGKPQYRRGPQQLRNPLLSVSPTMSANRIISSCIVAAALACTPAKPDPVLPPPPAVVNSFTATPKTITGPGQMVTLAWDTSDANRVMLEQVGKGQLEIDGTKPNGSLQVTVNADTTFVLTAIGEGGTDSAVQGVTLVGGGEMLLFDATSKTLDPGATTTLVWNAPGADAVTIKDASGAALDLKGQVSSGSLTVAPGASTHYDLEAGARTARVDVVVLPAIFSFTTSPSVAPGQPLQLSWRTSGGTKLTLTREGVGTPLKVETDVALVKNGGFTDTVPMNLPADGVLSYRLVLEDGPNHVENSAIARVAGSLKITRFTVPAYVRVGAPYSVSWATAGANSLELLVDGQVVYVAPDPVLAASSSATLPALRAPSARVQLRVKNDRGGELTEQRDITTVGLPTFVSFSADKTTIASGGEAVMVSWNVVNARDVRITQSGAGTVYAATGALDTGAVAVYPNQPITVLTLTATNGAGDGVAPATVTVAVTSLATLTFDRLLPAGALANVTGHTVVGGAEVWGLPTVAKNAPGEAWVDIQSTGFLVNHVTDASSALTTLPEPVDTVLYGRRVSMGSISTSPNGWFFFSPTTFDGPNTNGPIGSTFPALAVVPYFKDLFSVTGSEVYGRFDSVGSDRRFIIQWVDWEDRSYAGSRLSFQAQVFSSGKVVFAYGKLQGVTVADGAIGVFNGSQNQAITATSAPVVGDTFTFFASPATLPTPLRIESAPYQAKVSVGGGFIQVFGDGRLQPGELAISEINPRPAAGVTNGEWVELTNFSNKTINLNGWTLSSGSATHNIATDVMLPPNSVSVLAQATDLGDATSGVVATGVTLRRSRWPMPLAR